MRCFNFNTMNSLYNDACSCAPAFSREENMSAMDTVLVTVSIFVISIISLISIGAIILSILFLVIILCLGIQIYENMDAQKQLTGFRFCFGY